MHFIEISMIRRVENWHCHLYLIKRRRGLRLRCICHCICCRDSRWKVPIDARFGVPAMRNHLISCIMEKDLRPFPKVKQDNPQTFWPLSVLIVFSLSWKIYVSNLKKYVLFIFNMFFCYFVFEVLIHQGIPNTLGK